jgi:dipeptidyl aminopeptidase/acylaminoacyl peptidase
MWQLQDPRHKLWSRTLGQLQDQSSLAYARPVGRFSGWTHGSAFVQVSGTECVELDAKTGGMLRRFTLGPIENVAEEKSRARQLGWPEDLTGHLVFRGDSSDYDEKRGWMACGSWNDRRVRVFDARRPEKLLFEAHSRDEPIRPTEGEWSVQSVTFLAGGDYLKVEYAFSGRSRRGRRELEIYQTSSWQKVWQSDDVKLHGVTLTPDGRTIAYVRDCELVMMPFNP